MVNILQPAPMYPHNKASMDDNFSVNLGISFAEFSYTAIQNSEQAIDTRLLLNCEFLVISGIPIYA